MRFSNAFFKASIARIASGYAGMSSSRLIVAIKYFIAPCPADFLTRFSLHRFCCRRP